MTRLRTSIAVTLLALSVAAPATAQAPQQETGSQPKTLDELLEMVRTGMSAEQQEIEQREAEFRQAKEQQQRLLREAEQAQAAEEKRGATLEHDFDDNEKKLAEQEELLRQKLGTMGELFGVIRTVAGDAHSHIVSSITTAQFPQQAAPLAQLAQTKALPSVQQLEELWYTIQHEMTESGKVVRFPTTVVGANGQERKTDVVRVGVFNAVGDGRYLRWESDVQKLVELPRQPARRYLDTVSDLLKAKKGLVRFAIDPSRGSILDLLVQTPSFRERLAYGGLIGVIIMILGAAAVAIGLARFVVLAVVGNRVRRQQSRDAPNEDNPLGRVLAVYAANPGLDPEALELKMDEAIMREQAKLERFLWLIKVISVVAPLLGLLGTVTGMIKTFQAITLFGAGDPKLMAGGISEALVTTMQGLIVAIPLVLMHSWLSSMSRRVMDVLGEQSTGIVARKAEERVT